MKQQARQVQKGLHRVMHAFGRRCRGQRKVFLKHVRQTERELLEVGRDVGSLCLSAMCHLYEADDLKDTKRDALHEKLRCAASAYESIQQQSKRLVNGNPLSKAKIVNAYDPSITAIIKGKSNCPAQFGKKPGIIAEMATGFILGLHLPEGNPDDASYLLPLLDKVDGAIAPMQKRRKLRVISLAGDLAFNQTGLRNQLRVRGILTVGIPQSVDPIAAVPTPSMILAAQKQFDPWHIPSAAKVKTAYACGYSRPFVESLIETLSCRGGTHLKYKGHRGAMIQMTMAVLAHNAATLVRIQKGLVTERAKKFRKLFCLEPDKPLKNNNPKN